VCDPDFSIIWDKPFPEKLLIQLDVLWKAHVKKKHEELGKSKRKNICSWEEVLPCRYTIS